jgi:hypothetical protein
MWHTLGGNANLYMSRTLPLLLAVLPRQVFVWDICSIVPTLMQVDFPHIQFWLADGGNRCNIYSPSIQEALSASAYSHIFTSLKEAGSMYLRKIVSTFRLCYFDLLQSLHIYCMY